MAPVLSTATIGMVSWFSSLPASANRRRPAGGYGASPCSAAAAHSLPSASSTAPYAQAGPGPGSAAVSSGEVAAPHCACGSSCTRPQPSVVPVRLRQKLRLQSRASQSLWLRSESSVEMSPVLWLPNLRAKSVAWLPTRSEWAVWRSTSEAT